MLRRKLEPIGLGDAFRRAMEDPAARAYLQAPLRRKLEVVGWGEAFRKAMEDPAQRQAFVERFGSV